MSTLLPFILASGSSGGSSSGALVFKGSCNFSELPTTDQKNGDTYDILDDFTLGGKDYKAGTNVAWNGTSWDPLGGANSLPSGGTIGEILVKNSSTNYDINWAQNKALHFTEGNYKCHIYFTNKTFTYNHLTNQETQNLFKDTYNDCRHYFQNDNKNEIRIYDRYGGFCTWIGGATSKNWQNIDFHITTNDVIGIQCINCIFTKSNDDITGFASWLETATGSTTAGLGIANTRIYTPTSDYNPATKKYVDDNKGQVIQYSTIPTATSSDVGKIVQYIGTTNSTYTNGYFYIGTSTTETVDNEEVTTYSWEQIDVQPSSNNVPIFALSISTQNGISSPTAIQKQQIETMINYCYNNDQRFVAIHLIGEKYDTVGNNSGLILDTSPYRPLTSQTTDYRFYGAKVVDMGSLYFVYLIINGTWSNNVFTCTSISISKSSSVYNFGDYAKTSAVLTKTNTTSFTPTANYHPATKKYVDDAIATAITDALGGSY